jgi:hypothetical protein
MMEAANTLEKSVSHQNTRRNNPEASHFHIRRRENLKIPLNIFSFRSVKLSGAKPCGLRD